MAASCGGLPKPCTAAHRTGCAEDQRPDGGQDGAAHAKALGGDADEATTGDHVPCEGVQAPTMRSPSRSITGNSYAVHHLMRRLQHIRQHRSMTNFKMDRFILNSCFVVYISHYCWIWPIGQAFSLGRFFCFQGKMPLRSLQKLPAAASHIRLPLGKAMCAIPNQRKSANQT